MVVGNTYDKYGSKNPVVRRLMAGFEPSLSELVARAAPTSIHEVGCGEGYWVLRWTEPGIAARGRTSRPTSSPSPARTRPGSGSPRPLRGAQHLRARPCPATAPISGLLRGAGTPGDRRRPDSARCSGWRGGHLLLSVPQEPLWRALNLARGRYLRAGRQHPGPSAALVERGLPAPGGSEYFEVVEVRTPLPWTMVLCRSPPLSRR